jgi:hypothetical protein
MNGEISMRQAVAAILAAATLLVGWGAAAPAQADDRASYNIACLHQTDGNTKLCGCLADLAMSADPQLRADMILSMSNPNKYRATRAPHIPNNGKEMGLWEAFDVAGHKQCGMDI